MLSWHHCQAICLQHSVFHPTCRIMDTSVVGDFRKCSSCGEMRQSTMFSKDMLQPPHYLKTRCKACDAMVRHFEKERNALSVSRQSTAAQSVKECRLCSKSLPTSSFSVCRGSIDSFQHICKACMFQYKAEWRLKRIELFGGHPPIPPLPQERVCSQCKCTRPWTEFVVDRRSMYGVKPMCRECNRSNTRLKMLANAKE